MDTYEMNMVKPTSCIPDFVTSNNEAMVYFGTAIQMNLWNFSRSIEKLADGYFNKNGYEPIHEIDFDAIKEEINDIISKLWNSIKDVFVFILDKIKNLCDTNSSEIPNMITLKKILEIADTNEYIGNFHTSILADDIMEYIPDIKKDIDKCVDKINMVIDINKADLDDDYEENKVNIMNDLSYRYTDAIHIIVSLKLGKDEKMNVSFVKSHFMNIYQIATNYDINKKRIKNLYDYEYNIITSLQSKVDSSENIDIYNFVKEFTILSRYMEYVTKVGLGLLKDCRNECADILRSITYLNNFKGNENSDSWTDDLV